MVWNRTIICPSAAPSVCDMCMEIDKNSEIEYKEWTLKLILKILKKVCKRVWENFCLFFGCKDSAEISEFWQNSAE